MNNKGFTLVELLATISLLAVLTMIAVPNIIGIVNRNKNKTYVEDAKKLVSLAEYKVRTNPELKPSNVGDSKCLYMSTLGKSDFDTTAPNGGKYNESKSYVRVSMKSINGALSLKYSVTLVEDKDSKENKNGTGTNLVGILQETSSDNLYNDNISTLISSGSSSDTCS